MGASQALPSAGTFIKCTHECSVKEVCLLLDDDGADIVGDLPNSPTSPTSTTSTCSGSLLEVDDEALRLEMASIDADDEWCLLVATDFDDDGAAWDDQSSHCSSPKSACDSHSGQDLGKIASMIAMGQRKRCCGAFDDAVHCYDMALLMHRSVSQSGLRLRLMLLNSKAVALSSKGCGDLALKEYTKALDLCKALGLMGKVPEAVLLLNIGMACIQHLQDFDAAAGHFAKAFGIREKSRAWGGIGGALLLERIADVRLEEGKLDGAFESYTQAVRSIQAEDTMERLEGARLLTKLGTVDRMQRHFRVALQKYTHAASILIRIKATNIIAYARIQADIGITRRELGELSAARTAFEKALAIREQTNSLQSLGGVLLLMNYGTTLRMLDDQQGMLSQYTQARTIKKELGISAGPADVQLLVQISAAATELGEREWAMQSFLEAQRIRKTMGLPQSPEGARVLKAIGATILSRCSDEDDDDDEEDQEDESDASDVASPESKTRVWF